MWQQLIHFFINSCLSVLASCLIYARALLEYVILILWVRSFSKMLPYVKFAEDKVLVFVILRDICKNQSGIIERHIVVK